MYMVIHIVIYMKSFQPFEHGHQQEQMLPKSASQFVVISASYEKLRFPELFFKIERFTKPLQTSHIIF